jgi:hypothetical protein
MREPVRQHGIRIAGRLEGGNRAISGAPNSCRLSLPEMAYSTDSRLGFLAEFRWSPSFTNILDNGHSTVTNRSFEILAGVRFGL